MDQTQNEKLVIFRQFLVCWTVLMTMLASTIDAKCAFEAIFSFGDSNSDTGGFAAAFPPQLSPNGMTYFHRPTGRPSDGRLYIDFLGEFPVCFDENEVELTSVVLCSSSSRIAISESLSAVHWIRLQTWSQLRHVWFDCAAAKHFFVCLWS